MVRIAEFYVNPAVQTVLTWRGFGLAVFAACAWVVFKLLDRLARRRALPGSDAGRGGGDFRLGGVQMSGMPAWVGLSGLFGIVLLLLRLGGLALAASPAQIAEVLRGGYPTLEAPQIGEKFVALSSGGSAEAISLTPEPDEVAPRQGRWRVAERGSCACWSRRWPKAARTRPALMWR